MFGLCVVVLRAHLGLCVAPESQLNTLNTGCHWSFDARASSNLERTRPLENRLDLQRKNCGTNQQWSKFVTRSRLLLRSTFRLSVSRSSLAYTDEASVSVPRLQVDFHAHGLPDFGKSSRAYGVLFRFDCAFWSICFHPLTSLLPSSMLLNHIRDCLFSSSPT